MSSDCCTVPAETNAPGVCPRCDSRGQSVAWRTVAALTNVAVPPRQNFWLCRDADCDVVYFGDAGSCLGLSDLRVEPGFKASSKDHLVCYCFLYRRADIETELRKASKSTVFDRIQEEVKARNCVCDVRNPTGLCCLREVREETARLREALFGKSSEVRD